MNWDPGENSAMRPPPLEESNPVDGTEDFFAEESAGVQATKMWDRIVSDPLLASLIRANVSALSNEWWIENGRIVFPASEGKLPYDSPNATELIDVTAAGLKHLPSLEEVFQAWAETVASLTEIRDQTARLVSESSREADAFLARATAAAEAVHSSTAELLSDARAEAAKLLSDARATLVWPDQAPIEPIEADPRDLQISRCEEGLCVYVASKSVVTLDELAQWIAQVGGRSTEWAYGYLVNAAAKGLLRAEETEGLQIGERPVRLTKLGNHVASGLHSESSYGQLRATSARPTRLKLSGLDALTPRERRVVDLAATGRSNRDIAQTLFITVRTVEALLGRAYLKLGVTSRSDLAHALSAPAK